MTSPAQSGQIFVGDVSASLESLAADVVDLQKQINVLRYGYTQIADKVHDLEDAIGTSPPTDTPTDPDPGTPVPTPGTRNGKIGMNSGFVFRNDNPDVPSVQGYNDLLGPVCACYRPMDWNRINDDTTPYTSIDQKQKYHELTYRQSLALQVDVCNKVKANFYLNAPMAANEEFIRQAVQLIRTLLWSGGKIYVTYANECWNGGMGVHAYMKEQSGEELGGNPDNKYFRLWADSLDRVFSGARLADPNCIRVVETKTARDGQWYTEEVTKRLANDFDAVAGTLYFSPAREGGYWAGMSVDDLLNQTERDWQNDQKRWQEVNIRWAKDRGKLAIAYEGGQHLFDHTYQLGITDKIRQCQDHPRLIEMYRTVYGNAIAKGIDLILDYNFLSWWDQNGYWGKASNISNLPNSPKYQVVKEIAENN